MNDPWHPRCARPLVVFPRRLDPTGETGPTRAQARGQGYRQTSWGRYVPSYVDGRLVEQRIVEQAGRITRYGAVTAWAALRWRGAAYFDGTSGQGRTSRPVPLVVAPAKVRADPRVQILQSQLAPSERELVASLWCTTVQRALFDEMRTATNLRDAVVAMDMTAAARLISVRLMSAYVAQRCAWTGVPLVRRALALATDDSRSPQESRMRMVWRLDAGLPPPLCNPRVYDLEGNLIGVPDLFDPVAGLVGEYDGIDHKDAERHRSDVAREDLFRDHGLEYFEVVGGDMSRREMVVDRMLRARSRAKFLPPESCAWTLEPPPWVAVPETLDQELLRTGRAAFLTHT